MGEVVKLGVVRRNGEAVDRQTRELVENREALRKLKPKGPPTRRRRMPTRRDMDDDTDDGPAEPLGPGDEPGK